MKPSKFKYEITITKKIEEKEKKKQGIYLNVP
jgi:hypothetical protein